MFFVPAIIACFVSVENQTAARRGSNAYKTRYGLPWCWIRNSRMLYFFELVTSELYGHGIILNQQLHNKCHAILFVCCVEFLGVLDIPRLLV